MIRILLIVLVLYMIAVAAAAIAANTFNMTAMETFTSIGVMCGAISPIAVAVHTYYGNKDIEANTKKVIQKEMSNYNLYAQKKHEVYQKVCQTLNKVRLKISRLIWYYESKDNTMHYNPMVISSFKRYLKEQGFFDAAKVLLSKEELHHEDVGINEEYFYNIILKNNSTTYKLIELKLKEELVSALEELSDESGILTMYKSAQVSEMLEKILQILFALVTHECFQKRIGEVNEYDIEQFKSSYNILVGEIKKLLIRMGDELTGLEN